MQNLTYKGRPRESGSALIIVLVAMVGIGALQWTAQRKIAGVQRQLNLIRDTSVKNVLESYVQRSVDCAKTETHVQNCNSSTKYVLYDKADQVFLPGSTPLPKIGNFEVVGFCRRQGGAGSPKIIYVKIISGLLSPRSSELIQVCQFNS